MITLVDRQAFVLDALHLRLAQPVVQRLSMVYSAADRVMTLRLKEALALIDMPTLDHVIAVDNDTVSLSECGLL